MSDLHPHSGHEARSVREAILSEDRRRPRARGPYALLWLIVIGGVIFSVVAMILRA